MSVFRKCTPAYRDRDSLSRLVFEGQDAWIMAYRPIPRRDEVMPDLDLRALSCTRGFQNIDIYDMSGGQYFVVKTCYLKAELERNAAKISAIYDGNLSDEAADAAFTAMVDLCQQQQDVYDEVRRRSPGSSDWHQLGSLLKDWRLGFNGVRQANLQAQRAIDRRRLYSECAPC